MPSSSSNPFAIQVAKPAVQDLILLHDPDTEPVGSPAEAVSGVWNLSTDNSNTPTDTVDWAIRAGDDNPLVAGQQYWQTYMEALYQGSENRGVNYRTERSGSNQPFSRVAMSGAGGQDYVAPQKLWYAFLMRIDRMDAWGANENFGGGDGGGIIAQWHHREFAPPDDRDPPIALVHGVGGLQVRLEKNLDNGGSDLYSGVLPGLDESIVGETHAYLFEILWDSRSNDDGSTGLINLYVDDGPTPAWSWVDRQTVQPMPYLDSESPPRHPYFKWGGYRTAFRNNFQMSLPAGTAQQFSFGNYAVHGENATCTGVLESLRWNDVV